MGILTDEVALFSGRVVNVVIVDVATDAIAAVSKNEARKGTYGC